MWGYYCGILAWGCGSVDQVHCKVCTKTTGGQCSAVWLKQARLVSSLVFGTQIKLAYVLFAGCCEQNTQLMTFKY